MKPRSVKQAFEQDFIVTKIYAIYEKRIRVTFKRRFHKEEQPDFCEFWIDRKYFERKYPHIYERFLS